MWPHPILMETLWSDRNRKVLAAAAQQQNLDQLTENPTAKPLLRPHVADRVLALLAVSLRLRRSNAPGIPA